MIKFEQRISVDQIFTIEVFKQRLFRNLLIENPLYIVHALFPWGCEVQKNCIIIIFLLLDFGLSRLTSLQFIQYHVVGFYKPTIPQSTPSHLRDDSICNNARLEFSTIFVPSFDPNEWCLKNGLHSGSLNLGHLGHESSTLTTRPRLFA
jgi:hypothetical protein